MNKIKLAGTVVSGVELSHTFLGENFYKFDIESERTSGNTDKIPCIVPQMLVGDIKEGAKISLNGEIRSRNERDEIGTHCRLAVFVTEVSDYLGYDENSVELEGFICKEPKYRKTPTGREICDVLIASNRERSNKSDYIPCITWGRNAVRTSLMKVSDKVKVFGRFQSREYVKRYENDVEEIKTALEVSVNIISEVADES